MKVISQGWVFENTPDNPAQIVERAGRICYKSETGITPTSAEPFVCMLRDRGHTAMFDHVSASVRITCDRGISHEIVRHRIAAYAQESTRFCNYSKGKFDGELTFIIPNYLSDCGTDELLKKQRYIWHLAMQDAEDSYMSMLKAGAPPEHARSVLPNSLKTEIIVTMDFTSWRHFFKLRAANVAHPQMRDLTRNMLATFVAMWPDFFDDITFNES